MKKYLGFLIVLSLFILGGSKAQAAINPSTPCDINASPSITVLSPNGGETYLVGQQIEVKWRSCNIPSSAMITPVFSYVDENDVGEIHNGGAQSLNHVLNSGSAWITPPTSFLGTLGKHFKIKLVYSSSYATDPNGIQVLDYSDDTFTITKFENANKFPNGCNSAMGFSPTTGLPCFLDTYSATSVTKNSAVLNGRLIANAPAEMYFIYNETGNGNKVERTAKIAQQNNGSFSYILSNLSPNTSYDFKACMYYVGAERCARQLTFKTFPASGTQEEDGCKNSEIYSSITGQKCSTTIEPEQKPSVTVLSPNGGETYLAGQQVEVRWETKNIPGNIAEINLMSVNGWGGGEGITFDKDLLNDGHEIITLPSADSFISANAPFGKYFKIEIVAADNTGTMRSDFSDNTFTVTKFESTTCSVNSAPSITVLSPNGGEIYKAGQQVEVRWKSCNIPIGEMVTLYLDIPSTGVSLNMGVQGPFTTENDGKVRVNLPAVPSYGNLFEIHIVQANNSLTAPMDTSDNTFTITTITDNSDFKVLSPNGGENYLVGQPINISLNGGLYMTRVGLVYPDFNPYKETNDGNDVHWLSVSSNAGTSFVWDGVTFIDNNGNINPFATGPGQYKIVAIKDVNENKCYLKKISNCVFDLSDSTFSLTEGGDIPTNGRITLLSPQSGSRITAGSKVEVRWESSNLPPRSGNTLKMIIKRNGVLVREFRAEDDGNEIVTIPLFTPNGEYQLEYGTISPSSGGGDHFVKYGSAYFIVETPGNPIDCKPSELYSSTTGQKCLHMNEVEQKCDSASGCYSIPVARTLKIGVKGEDVKYIQTLLGITADGSFGPVTALKVKEWQAQKQLKADGIIGPQSISAMSQ